jgi:1-acyl-sn-glycerol-3-phosphate acyltransferase
VTDGHQVRIAPGVWWLARVLLGPIFRLVFRLRWRGAENIPASGPTLFVANHISMWDPPMIGYAWAGRRRIFFMAKQELFAHSLVARTLRRGGAFPVDRGGADRTAIRTARDILARGGALLMFPEGTRFTSGKPGPALPGAGALGLAEGIQVIPIVISGSNRRFGPARIIIGGPLDLSDLNTGARGERSQMAADRMMAAIAALSGDAKADDRQEAR